MGTVMALVLNGCGFLAFMFLGFQRFPPGIAVLLVFTFFASYELASTILKEGAENQTLKTRLGLFLCLFGLLYLGVIFVYFTLDRTTGYLAPLGGYYVSDEARSNLVALLFGMTVATIVPVWTVKAGFTLSKEKLKVSVKTAAWVTLLALALGFASIGSAYATSEVINTARESRLPPYWNERLAILGFNVTADCVYVQNVGEKEVTITHALIKDSSGNLMMQGSVTNGAWTLPAHSSQETITVSIDLSTLPSNSFYTMTIISINGGAFVSPAFKVP